MNLFKKAALGTALAATAVVSTTPAMARDYRRGHDDTAAIAIGAGVIGLALGAIVASSNNENDRYRDRYYDSGYSPAYSDGWYYRDGYYQSRDGHRMSRSDYERWQREDYRRGYGRGDYNGRRGY